MKRVVKLALALAAVAIPLYALKVYEKTDYTDFSVYHLAATRMAAGQWDKIYNLGDGAAPFRYPPLILPLFRWLAALDLRKAQLAWYFVQVTSLLLGFLAIFGAVRLATGAARGRKAQAITALSFLFVLRFCLDSFTIGQVSGVMFGGWALALVSFMLGRGVRAGAGLFVPALFKISPGFSYFLLLARMKPKAKGAALLAPLVIAATLLGALSLWPKGGMSHLALWSDWARIVALDSTYYDSSHYGSQSLNSVLLRWVNAGLLRPAQALEVRLFLGLVVCSLTVLFWALYRWPRARGRGLAFSLGVFPYLWFMPETFKYSLIMLAIPVAMLLSARRFTPLAWLSLGFGALTLSLPGKDIVGDAIFFGLQHHSAPFWATVLLGMAAYAEAWKEARPSRFLIQIRGLLKPVSSGPWSQLPERVASCDVTLIVPLPLSSTKTLTRGTVSRALSEACQAVQAAHPGSHEILVVPYGDRLSALAPELEEAREALPLGGGARILHESRAEARGTALREAFLASRGKTLWVCNLEQPCDVEFFARASALLAEGFDLVRANRRHPESRFRIPVRVLPYVYGRHRLGLLFNRLVRLTLPIEARDTHSGTAVLSRRLAAHAFSLQRYPEFLFELEWSLTALGHGLRETAVPVRVLLPEEKTIRRMSRETVSIALGLPALLYRYRLGFYSTAPGVIRITADDWGISPEVNSGILELARQGVIRRVSLMASCPYLESGLEELKNVPGIELGLHFNLTYGEKPLGPNGPGRFLLDWCQGGRERLAPLAKDELRCQLDRLEQAGVRTSYVDGHHHIHLVPGMLRTIAPEIHRRGIKRVRLPFDRRLILSPKLPLVVLSLLARGELKRQGFEHFPCVYPFTAYFADQGRLQVSLARDPSAEVIVHPARSNDFPRLAITDSYSEGRVLEYRALAMLAYRLNQ
jgi:predicted glycoside hydrolase/deacetylase ChbG (UPF0249 family)